jgi:hypothetical protein
VKRGPSSQTNAQPSEERRALLSYALFRWESAAVLALTLILAVLLPDPFGGLVPAWRWWFWVLLGLGAEAAILLTTLQDPDVRAQVAANRLRAQLAPASIANLDYRQIAERALTHHAEIQSLLHRTRRKAARETLRPAVDDAARWAASLVQLALRLDDPRPDDSGGPGSVPAQAETLLHDSLRALETTYARLQLIVAQGLNQRRVKQLCGEIQAQIRVLQETMENLP